MLQQKKVLSVLNRHKQRDNWFLDEYSVNPYEGCSCNCLYCYIRGSKYGEHMEERLAVKVNALEVLEKQLYNRAKKSQYGIVALGSATDAYLPHESHYRLTEGFLKLFLQYRFPVFISTKSTLITRDIELLRQIDHHAILPADLRDRLRRGIILSVSVSTLDESITNMLEPGAATPLQRLELVRQLKAEGFLTGVNAIPMLPYISDTEEALEKMIAAAKQYEADYILVGGLTLFGEGTADSKTLYYKFLERYDPTLIARYKDLYRDRYSTPKQYQEMVRQKSDRLCKKYQIRNSII